MTEKIRQHENHILCGLVTYLAVTSFINQDLYAFTTVYASLIIFAVLAVMALPYALEGIKDKEIDLMLAAMTPILAFIFAIASHSGMGAVLIPSDLALICYVARHVRLTERAVRYIAFVGAAPVILWYSHVRWSYNFNMAGFVFMLMAFYGMILTELIELKYKKWICIMIYITSFLISTLYHSRTAVYGLVMFGIMFLLWRIMSTKKWVYTLVFLLATAGSVAFTGIYMYLSDAVKNLSVLNKEIFSGREAIWRELWGAFALMPVTGIGSGRILESFEIFEVHNGMFDILTVHGAAVFILVLIQLWRMFDAAYPKEETTGKDMLRRISLAAAFSMMFTSYFENFFIVPPYSILFMTFAVIACSCHEITTGVSG